MWRSYPGLDPFCPVTTRIRDCTGLVLQSVRDMLVTELPSEDLRSMRLEFNYTNDY